MLYQENENGLKMAEELSPKVFHNVSGIIERMVK